jgi:hypothetical protein
MSHAIIRAAPFGRFGGVLGDLGEVDMRDEVVRVGALQHHDPDLLVRFQRAEQADQVAHQFRSDQVHRRRVNHHTDHTLVARGDRSVRYT